MTAPLVSIVILNFNHPEIIDICLHTLAITEDVDYEVVVVDNGSTHPDSLPQLRQWKEEGLIDTLVENPVNGMFSGGNNVGVRNSNPASEFILLLNSDVAFLRPDWLKQLVGWMNGTTKYWPSVWGLAPTTPSPGPRDIVSAGWSHDANIEGNVRPEGWCCLIRRTVFSELSEDFPHHFGFEEMIANAIRGGAKCGVLFNYAPYMVHREQGSGATPGGVNNTRQPDMTAWFSGLKVESLDFTLGPNEHDTYMCW